uniref:Uncharacterized protein n=1 Tax=Arundo donax TaxID=35708 RepID=A0A0A9A3W2_ARUDO
MVVEGERRQAVVTAGGGSWCGTAMAKE